MNFLAILCSNYNFFTTIFLYTLFLDFNFQLTAKSSIEQFLTGLENTNCILSMVSIKRPGLNFLQKYLFNDLFYLKFWELWYMKINEIKKVSRKRPGLSWILNPESLKRPVLIIKTMESIISIFLSNSN